MTIRLDRRYAILIGRQSRYRSQIAYALAHELGHIVLHHINSAALIEAKDPLQTSDSDDEERDADAFALQVLTGTADPHVDASITNFSASQLASAVMAAGPDLRIDPGILALCLGHATGRWRQAFGAQKLLPAGEVDVAKEINDLARLQLRWFELSADARQYLTIVMGGESEP